MKNLAGNKECDADIRHELKKAAIQAVELPEPLRAEVPASVEGQLTKDGEVVAVFRRAWYCWMVGANVPLEVAKEMYADPTGVEDVRVAGHCGCPPPEEWATPLDKEVAEAMERLGLETITHEEIMRLQETGEIKVGLHIKSYHIDTQEGLNLFATTMRKHGLAD